MYFVRNLTLSLRGLLCVATVPLLIILLAASISVPVSALGSQQNPQNGSVGLEGTITAPPPTQAASIGSPSSGQIVKTLPITVSGLCKTGLLVKIFSNNIF